MAAAAAAAATVAAKRITKDRHWARHFCLLPQLALRQQSIVVAVVAVVVVIVVGPEVPAMCTSWRQNRIHYIHHILPFNSNIFDDPIRLSIFFMN